MYRNLFYSGVLAQKFRVVGGVHAFSGERSEKPCLSMLCQFQPTSIVSQLCVNSNRLPGLASTEYHVWSSYAVRHVGTRMLHRLWSQDRERLSVCLAAMRSQHLPGICSYEFLEPEIRNLSDRQILYTVCIEIGSSVEAMMEVGERLVYLR